MKLIELKNGLEKAVKLPVIYAKFKTDKKTPYIVIIGGGETHIYADDTLYDDIEDIDIELYTSEKSLELEIKIKEFLLKNELNYEKITDVIEKDFIKTTFEIEI